ncbi:MAG: prepilin-type N-terminal cleavage/methylation domain-containing protein [Opitutaceae bacterium]|nr:prepilin-type N-terminal cleavage/methylation domain-containing protein [Opitutaceae bacterium]
MPHRAFTLLELLAVLAIIGALAGLMLGVGSHVFTRAKRTRAEGELATLAAALETYRRRHGDYPCTADAAALLQALLGRRDPLNRPITAPAVIDLAHFAPTAGTDPQADPAARLVDPWGNPYDYAYRTLDPWENSGYILQSAGPDGVIYHALLPGGFIAIAHPDNADNVIAPR